MNDQSVGRSLQVRILPSRLAELAVILCLVLVSSADLFLIRKIRELDSAQVKTGQRSGRVAIQVEVQGAGLSFVHNQGRYKERLEMLAGLFDAAGRFVTGERGVMEMDLKPPTWRRFMAEGVKPGLSLEAPPGAYTLRVLVGESNGGKLSAFSQPVAIPVNAK